LPRILAGLLLSGVLLASTGCPRGPVDSPPRANRMRSGHAPTPFSADQIRKTCQPGVWRRYRVTAQGRPVSVRTLRFERANQTGVIVASTMTDLKGAPVGEQRRVRSPWKGLQSHASFRARSTTIRTERRTTPAGTFECWRYDVTQRVGSHREVRQLWFAKTLPGPPVELIRRIDGKIVLRMTLVSKGRSRPTSRVR
jgi:hypothetical protein